MENKEIFKDIKGYEGLYQISNLGKVKRIPRNIVNKNGYSLLKEMFLTPYVDDVGYFRIGLKLNSKTTHRRIHRLIATTFIPNPENKPQVNHINGIKTDNRLENLEWVTSLENTNHAIKAGLIKRNGENNASSKLIEIQVLDIKERLKKGETGSSIAKIYNVHASTISLIKRNIKWNHLNN